MMDDDLVCSDFGEENGFARPAELLRALAGGTRKAYVVMERGAEYNDEIVAPRKQGEPQSIFLDRARAERVAADRNTRWYRENNILDHCYDLKEVCPDPADQLAAKIAAILGRDYSLPNGGQPTFEFDSSPLIDGPATDEQMLRIAELFTLKFFYIAETEFAPSGRDGRLFPDDGEAGG